MDSVSSAIDLLGAIASRRQLVARGYGARDLTRAVASGSISRVRRGWYATHSATRDQLVAVRVGGRLTHLTAARSFGLWSGRDPRIHVAVRRNASRLRSADGVAGRAPDAEVVLHWTDRGPAHPQADTWRVSLATCLRSVVRRADRETAIACVDTAIEKYGLPPARLVAMFGDEPVRSRLIVRQTHGGCDSGLESIACQRFTHLGITVQHQVRFAGIRSVDLLLGRRVIVELDGREFHDLSAAFTRDRRNDAELVALGYVVLRFTYAQVMFEWDFVERTVLAALAANP